MSDVLDEPKEATSDQMMQTNSAGRALDGQLQQISEIQELNQDLDKSEEDQPQAPVEGEATGPDEESLIDDDDEQM